MEVIHIRLHPDNINKDNGIDIPEARIPTIKKHNGRPEANRRGNNLESDLSENQNSPEQRGSKSANRIRSPWCKW